MRLGYYTDYSEETAAFASETGFTSLELRFRHQSRYGQRGPAGRDPRRPAGARHRNLRAGLLSRLPGARGRGRAESKRYFLKVLDLAQRMEVPVVCTFVGRNPYCTVEENMGPFQELFTEFCQEAEERGLRIAIENCPMVELKTGHSINLAFSPEIWDRMFEMVPSSALGIEMDPSHMVWQGIDYIKAIRDYGERIYHVHAKDMEIRHDVLQRVGILGQSFGEVFGLGHGWWRGRAPGWGEVDWPAFISALIEVGYEGNIDIEHEDDVLAFSELRDFKADMESSIVMAYGREHKGLLLGYQTLAPLIPGHKR